MNLFGVNKSPAEVISEGAFGGTYFRDIYSGFNGKWYHNSWKEFKFLSDMDKKLYASSYYDVKVNKYSVKVGTSLRFWESKGWINSIDPYGWFQWFCWYWLGRRSSDASKTSGANEMSGDERQIKRWKAIVNRFKSVLVKMIKDKGAKFDDYSVSPKIRQILLHWGYELVESDCF